MAEIDNLIQGADFNGDGKINYDEFIYMIANRQLWKHCWGIFLYISSELFVLIMWSPNKVTPFNSVMIRDVGNNWCNHKILISQSI